LIRRRRRRPETGPSPSELSLVQKIVDVIFVVK
jgi:hypothetical protein